MTINSEPHASNNSFDIFTVGGMSRVSPALLGAPSAGLHINAAGISVWVADRWRPGMRRGRSSCRVCTTRSISKWL
jgi:hypothetical protein